MHIYQSLKKQAWTSLPLKSLVLYTVI